MGRYPEERLALRLPRIWPFVRNRIFALAPGSPLRRRVVKMAMAHGWEAIARRDYDAATIAVAPDYELNMFGEQFRALGVAERYNGVAGMREFMEQWRAAWGSLDYQVDAIYDYGDRIVARFTTTSRGLASGVEVSATAGSIYYIGGGAVVRQDFYFDWEECRTALGLEGSEWAPD